MEVVKSFDSFLNFRYTKLFNRNISTFIFNKFKTTISKNGDIINSHCTSLEIYGSNLGSTLNIGRFSRNLQKLIYLSPNIYSVIVGIIWWLVRKI